MTAYNVKNATAAPFPPGALLNLFGFDQNTGLFEGRLADATTIPSRPAHVVTIGGILPGGTDTNTQDAATTIANADTASLGIASAAIYLGTAGAQYAAAAPSGGLSQQVATIGVASHSVGTFVVVLTPDLSGLMPVPIQTAVAVDETGSAIAVDVLVAVNGIDDAAGSVASTVVQADADGHIPAQYVVSVGAADEGNVQLVRTGLSQANLDTNAGNVGDPVYLSTTAGGWTLVAPSASNSFVQEVGRVLVKSATVGQIKWDIKQPVLWGSQEVRASVAIALDGVTLDSSGAGSTAEIKNLGVATGKIAANAVDATKLAQYANGGLTPGPVVTLALPIPDHATGNVDFVIAAKMVVTDVMFQNTGANTAVANTIQVDNGTGGNHITDAMSTNNKGAADIVRAAQIDTTHGTIAAGGTLRVVQTRAGGVLSGNVVVTGYLSA